MEQRDTSIRSLEDGLRELCAYYEWSEPPNLAAADVLQAAADALQCKQITADTAQTLITLWQPFAAFEPPAVTIVAQNETELEDAILADMERLMFRETNSAKKLHLQQLVIQQIRRFKERGDCAQKRASHA